MRRKPVLGVDICNTIAEVNREIGKVFGLPDWRPYRYSMAQFGVVGPEVDEFFLRHPEVFEKARPVEGAVEALRELSRLCRIAYITARPPEVRGVTEWWLKEHGFPPGLLIMGEDKPKAARIYRAVAFVEDSPSEIARLSKVCRVLPVGWEYNGSQARWTDIQEMLGVA
ncbi:MAG: hypothetical protein NUW23_12510 [Firmicutes bacterium]|jgi:uncharacterized HAD superfamily protein|nr:hypothetical protein [Bacillota bacterium]